MTATKLDKLLGELEDLADALGGLATKKVLKTLDTVMEHLDAEYQRLTNPQESE